MFADAGAILINTVKDEVRIIQELLNSFGKASGLATNLSKSAVFPIRCENVDLTDVMSHFQIPLQQQHSLFSQASWGSLEMKLERNKFKVQSH